MICLNVICVLTHYFLIFPQDIIKMKFMNNCILSLIALVVHTTSTSANEDTSPLEKVSLNLVVGRISSPVVTTSK